MDQEKPFHHGNLRMALLLAVRDIVEARGPNGVTIAEAARSAGVSRAAPYKHFKDRSDLLKSAVCEGMDRLRTAMETGRDRHAPGTLDGIAAAGVGYISFARTEPGMFRLIFSLTETHAGSPALAERGRATFGVVLDATARFFGTTSDDAKARRCAYQLWTAVHGHSFLAIDKKVEASDVGMSDGDFAREIALGILGAR